MSRPAHRLHAMVIAAPLLVAAGLLPGCGGGGDAPTRAGALAVAQPREAVAAAPLLADDGSVMPADPRAVPAHAGARTRAGRYATRAQAEQLQGAADVLAVPVACCRVEAADEALGLALAMHAALDRANGATFVVDGPDLRLAAVVADRLADAGFSRVFLVTTP